MADASCAPCEVSETTPATPPAFFFARGKGTYRVQHDLPRAARRKLVAALAAAGHADGVVLLRGGVETTRNDTDHEPVFRQESYFQYFFGVAEPDCYGMIELPSGRATLFVPRLAPEYAVWMGAIKPPGQFKARYRVDACDYTDRVAEVLASTVLGSGGEGGSSGGGDGHGKIYVLAGENTDSGLDIAKVLPVSSVADGGVIPSECVTRVDRAALYEIAAECRVVKSADEIDLMRYVAWVASCAHASVMRDARPGMMEYQLEALFLFHCAFHGGCRHAAYTSICACGPNSSVLHYGHAGAPNDRLLEPSDMALLDMGCEYFCYASDITCSFPVSGDFTPDQRLVYEAVLDAQRQILGQMRPGVAWSDMHALMWRVILTHLRRHGLVVGEVEDMLAANLGQVFTPHGLGHLIGIDTHDVGGYLSHTPQRSAVKGLDKLRTARVLAEGMALTVEPGCYFIDALLDDALADPARRGFLAADRLEGFRGFGGVRLEDVVVVTVDGVDNLTLCPRTVVEVEKVMRGGEWPPTTDAAPWLKRRWMVLDKPSGTMVPDRSVRVETSGFSVDADF